MSDIEICHGFPRLAPIVDDGGPGAMVLVYPQCAIMGSARLKANVPLGLPMKFLCLGYLNVEAFDRQPETVKNSVLAQCEAHCLSMRATGKVLMEEGVESPSTAKSIRPQNGKPTVTEGPFLDVPEQLGSFFIVEADTIDEAVAIASKHPAAMLGEEFGFGIEVRPIQGG